VIGAGAIGRTTVGVIVTLFAAALVTVSAIVLLESSRAIRTVIEEQPAGVDDGSQGA
jgi:predicted homoserine dehydrogenase-like protein